MSSIQLRAADFFYRGITFSLATTRDKDIDSFGDELFGSGEPNAAGAIRNEGDFERIDRETGNGGEITADAAAP